MSVPGRKPKPRPLRAVDGDTNHGAPKAKGGVQVPAVCPDRPDWPSLIPDADERFHADCQRVWDEIVPDLHALEVLTRLDTTIVVDACVCFARIRQCERVLGREGLVIPGREGTVVKHPVLTALNQYRSQLRFYVSELGLGPATRTRLTLGGAPPDDGDDLFD